MIYLLRKTLLIHIYILALRVILSSKLLLKKKTNNFSLFTIIVTNYSQNKAFLLYNYFFFGLLIDSFILIVKTFVAFDDHQTINFFIFF